MSAAGFGRKGSGPDAELAARRAAFLAEERARAQRGPSGGEPAREDFARPRPIEQSYVVRKKAGTAYLLWFFMGGFSAHRFYLGFPASAVVQLLLTPLGYVMLMSKSPSGLALTGAAALWLLADAALIPGMVTKANERGRGASLASTFA